MKLVCPRCRSSAFYVMTDGTNHHLIEELLSPAVLIGLSVSLCKTLKVHPAIGVVVGTAIASIAEITSSHNVLSILVDKQYRCDDCTHVFSTFH